MRTQDSVSAETTVKATVSAALEDAAARAGRLTKELVDEVRDKFPETTETLQVFVDAYFNIRSYDRVEQLGNKVLRLDPANFPLRLRIIKLITERRKTVEIKGDPAAIAYAHLQTAERQPGLSREDWLTIAGCYMDLRAYAAALPPALKAVEMSDGRSKVSARLRLAEVLLASGDRTGAGRELKGLREELSNHDHLIRGALLSQDLGLAEDAVELARRAVLCLPAAAEAPNSYINLGRIFFRQNVLEDGRAVLRKAGVLHLKDGGTLRRFHDVCFDLALNDLALAYGLAALDIRTDDYALYERVQLLKILQKHPSVPAALQEAKSGEDSRPRGGFFKVFGRRSGQS